MFDCLVKLYLGLKKMKTRMRIFVLVLVLMVVVATLIFQVHQSKPDRWDQEAQQLTIEATQPLIEAINAYTKSAGSVPQSLEDLVPEWITEIPTPIVGSQQWSYSLTKRGYDLRIKATKSEPPSLLWMMIFGPSGYDDRMFVYYPTLELWEMADW